MPTASIACWNTAWVSLRSHGGGSIVDHKLDAIFVAHAVAVAVNQPAASSSVLPARIYGYGSIDGSIHGVLSQSVDAGLVMSSSRSLHNDARQRPGRSPCGRWRPAVPGGPLPGRRRSTALVVAGKDVTILTRLLAGGDVRVGDKMPRSPSPPSALPPARHLRHKAEKDLVDLWSSEPVVVAGHKRQSCPTPTP